MKYYYYRIYKALTKVKTNTTPALNAMLLLVVLQGFNIYTVYIIIKYYFVWKFDNHQITIGGLALFIIVFIPNYIFLYRKRNKIIKRYQNETKEDRIWGTIGFLLYVVISITVFFVTGETMR